MANEEHISVEEAASQLGKSADEITAMITAGELHGVEEGGSWKVLRADVEALSGEEGDARGDTLMSIDADIVFAEDEQEPADSAAETWIAAETQGVFESAPAGVEDAMRAADIEPAPLSLSPESDDTSLGAILDEQEIEGEPLDEPVIAVDSESGFAALSTPTPRGPSRTQIVTLVEGPAYHGAFTVLLVFGLLLMGFTVFVLIAGAMGVWLAFADNIQENAAIYGGISILVVAITAIIGVVLEKQRKRRETLAAMTGK